jgi:hypothetical protein
MPSFSYYLLGFLFFANTGNKWVEEALPLGREDMVGKGVGR